MTTSRIVRGTKIKVFLSFCGIVVILGLLACYNNTLTELNEIQKAISLCHLQQENLSTQLQVISEYKLRIEKALKAEKDDHLKSNNTYNQLNKDEKSKNEKITLEAKLRFDSLQQRYNLLQTEYDDFKEKTSKTQQEQQEENNDLQIKFKEIQDELKNVKNSKEKLKTDYLNVQLENDKFKREMEGFETNSAGHENKTNYLLKQNQELKREIEKLKENYENNPIKIDPPVVLVEDSKIPVMPIPIDSNLKSSSTTSSVKSSQGSLNGARPLAVPTMTPKNNSLKIPQGVLPIPNKLPEPEKNEIIDERYKNKIEENKDKDKKHEDVENDNVGNEVFEQNLGDDGLGFVDKQNIKQHIDNLGKRDDEYKHIDENVGIDEGEDDDQDEYGDHLGRHKEPPAVRN